MNFMKLSKLIQDLTSVAKANGSYDPECRVVGDGVDQSITMIGTLGDFMIIMLGNERYVPCRNCGQESDRLCWCDK